MIVMLTFRLLGNVVRELCCMRDGQLQTDLNKDD